MPVRKKQTEKNVAASLVWRLRFLAVVLLALAVTVVWKIASHQVVAGEKGSEFLQAEGDARSLRMETITALRGMITDRNGEPLAVSTPVTTLWANPKYLINEAARLPELASALGQDEQQLADRIQRYRNKSFMYLKRQMSPAAANRILDLDIAGVYGQREYKRFYPAGEVTSHLVGFTSIDQNGQEGVELAFDEWLKGVSGKKQVLKDLKGRVIKDVRLIQPAESGKELRLSLDLRVQYLAYRALKKTISKYRARGGSVVVLDSQTGEVLAMVNQPSFNPNNRFDLKPDAMRNRAVVDMFEPGSTVKPLTMAAALESGEYSADTVIDTSPGRIKVGRKTLLDPVNYGPISLTKIIAKSSQVGTTKVAMTLDANDIRSVFHRVGLGQVTGSGFPGESVGLLPLHHDWKPIEQATFSFGHGLSVTTLQLAQAYSVIANSGLKRQISLVHVEEPRHEEQVMPQNIARTVLDMMENVTRTGGTGTRAAIPAYGVAGKTGTVHKIVSGEYADDRYLALFAGVAPVESPRFVSVVVIDEPASGKYYGGEVAAPVFSEVVSATLRLYSVLPDAAVATGSGVQPGVSG
jgi:cell division protein FtsI (penicillin-binding protein 3)